MPVPDVSILLPVRNEEDHLDDVLSDLLGQKFDGTLEVIVADGLSSDATPRLLDDWSVRDDRLRVITNDGIHQSNGLNAAAAVARADVLIRADGHSRYASDYVSSSIAALGELGGAVGGRMNPRADSGTAAAVAAAMNSPLTMGPARFHHAEGREEVDTVYLGCFAKDEFQAVGGFRHFPSGSSEDADFYFRWRNSGRSVYIDPHIQTSYSPRSSFRSLWRQYWRYGQGKTEMLWVNGRFPSIRPLAPMALVLGLVAGVVLAAAGASVWWLVGLVLSWLLVLSVVGASSGRIFLRVVAVAGCMHLAYGLGAFYGLLRGPWRLKHLRD